MKFSIYFTFTMCENHHFYLAPNISINPERNQLLSSHHFVPSPAPGNHRSSSCLYVCVRVDFWYKWNHIICNFYDWFLSLIIKFSSLIRVVACARTSLFLWLNNILCMYYVTFCLSVPQLVDICILSTFWLLWILLWTSTYNFLFE